MPETRFPDTLKVELSLPIELDNKFANRAVDWVFNVEAYKENESQGSVSRVWPDDNTNQSDNSITTNIRSLIQTGQLNWPIWVLGGTGLVLVILGGAILVKKKRRIMAKRTGIAMVAAGAVLILCALLLLMHNRREDAYAGQEAESLLAELEEAIPVQSPKTSVTEAPKKHDPELPVVMLDGYGYVGYLEFLTLELKLPVMAEWDYKRLKISPCRQSARDGVLSPGRGNHPCY